MIAFARTANCQVKVPSHIAVNSIVTQDPPRSTNFRGLLAPQHPSCPGCFITSSILAAGQVRLVLHGADYSRLDDRNCRTAHTQ